MVSNNNHHDFNLSEDPKASSRNSDQRAARGKKACILLSVFGVFMVILVGAIFIGCGGEREATTSASFTEGIARFKELREARRLSDRPGNNGRYEIGVTWWEVAFDRLSMYREDLEDLNRCLNSSEEEPALPDPKVQLGSGSPAASPETLAELLRNAPLLCCSRRKNFETPESEAERAAAPAGEEKELSPKDRATKKLSPEEYMQRRFEREFYFARSGSCLGAHPPLQTIVRDVESD